MQFRVDGQIFKATHISGPTHNYLGLSLAENGDTGSLVVEPLTLNSQEPVRLDVADIQDWVSKGVASANRDLATQYRLKRIEFVVSDSPRAEIYELLARRIIERIHAHPNDYTGPND